MHSRWFEMASLFLILCNTLILCLYHHDMEYSLEQGLEHANLLLTQVFTLELIIKILGEGLLPFLQVPFNIADLLIVLVSQVRRTSL